MAAAKRIEDKSIHELRTQAQAMGIAFTLADSAGILRNNIRALLRQPDAIETAPIVHVVPVKNLARPTTHHALIEALKPFMAHGLRFDVHDNGTWAMSVAGRTDSGNLHMPTLDIVRCAQRLMRP